MMIVQRSPRRALALLMAAALLLPLLASCSGGGKSGFATVATTAPVTFTAPAGEESLAGLTDPYCTNQRLFESGGRVNYRIPSLFITNDGTLVAAISQRFDTTDDYAEEKYVVVRRSADGGLSWTEDAYLNYLNNYCVDIRGGVYDAVNDALLLFLSTAASSADAQTNYKTLAEADRPFIGRYVMKSTDSGATWEFHPVTFLPDPMGTLPQVGGNDRGVQIPAGPYAGRLVVGARATDYNYLMYSDDGGDTWQTGGAAQFNTGECALAVLPDGTVYINSRAYDNDGGRREGWSYDGGRTIVGQAISADLIEPCYGCNASVITFPHPETGETVMLYSGINNFVPDITSNTTNRYNLSVWISYDEGKTWPVCKTIEPDRSAYSSMTYDPKTGLIYILYETGHEMLYDRGANMVTCNLAWLESDAPLPAYTFAQPAGTWQERASDCFAGGSGTESDPYLVATAEELALIARLTNYGQDLSGIYFKQITDIDLAGCEWTPIGRASSWGNTRVDYTLPVAPFSGTYDGGGHIINNLTSDTLQRSGVGLFGFVQDATIRNVFVDNGYVHSTVSSSGVVGWVAGKDATVLENCFFRGRLCCDHPDVDSLSRGCYDAGYRDGEPYPGDVSVFTTLSIKTTPKSRLPSVDEGSWKFLAADTYAGGDGSAEDPYRISTAAELALFANEVNAGESYQGVHFVLTADIDLSGPAWHPIGWATFSGANHLSPTSRHQSFMGVLDGGGHTVTGMRVDVQQHGAGFFAYLCGGTVRNLAVQGSVKGMYHVGGFVGFLRPHSESPTTIENCFFEGTVEGIAGNVGGFIGRTHQMSGCTDELPANSPAFGLLRNVYSKAVVMTPTPTDVTVTLFFGGQFRDKPAWTVSNCNAVNDLPENAGIAVYRSTGSAANGITSAAYDQAYAAFRK